MRPVLLFLGITVLVFFLPQIGKAQPYYFKHFETDDGLVNNSVNVITQDRKGFIWIGTRGGLARFDGYVFKTFGNSDSQSGNLWNNYITAIAEDSKGILWIGTGKGIFKYDPATERFSPLDAGPQAYINGFVIDARDDLWILGQNRLYFYSQKTNKAENLNTHVSRIAMNFDGNLLLGNYDGILFNCNTKTKEITQRRAISSGIALNMRAITRICPIDSNRILIGYRQGLIIYDLVTNQSKTIPLLAGSETGTFVRDIHCSKTGEYWIATETGLYIYDLLKDRSIRLPKNQGDPYALSDNVIYSVFRDRSGDMWVGTFFGGLNYHSVRNARFEKYYPVPLAHALSGNAVSQIWSDQNNSLYIGTEDAGLSLLELKTSKVVNYANDKNKKSGFYSNIHSLAGYGNQLFIGSYYHGMQIMDRRTSTITDVFKVIAEPGENGSDFAVAMYLARDSTLYIGTAGDYGGLYRYHTDKKIFSRLKQIKPGTAIYHIAEDHTGTIWAGQHSQQVFYLQPKTGKHGLMNFGDPKNESSVHYILEDSDQALWFSTIGNGLIKLAPDRKTFRKYTVKDGLPSEVLYGMLEDDDKQLWIGSTKGLVCLNLRTSKIRVYTQADGLITDQFNLNSAHKGPDGKLYFGTIKGLIAFDPKVLRQKEPSPQTYFTGFQINNSEVVPDTTGGPLRHSIIHTDTIKLAPDQNNFSIEFASLNFSSTTATRYKYKMSGVDRSWNYSNTNRKAYFTDLSPGRYTFTVAASSPVGAWTSKERRLFIEVLPTIWQSNAAYLIYLLFGLVSLFLIIQYYHQYQKKRHRAKLRLFEHEKEKEVYQAKIEFFTHIAHEIQTPLTLISVPVGRVLKKADEYPSIKNSLLTIGKYTNRLVELTTQLLDFRQTEIEQFSLNFVNVDIKQLIREQADAFFELAAENKIAIRTDLPAGNIVAFVDREAFNKICSNLISNAIKYTETVVTIHLSAIDEGIFSVTFTNDGMEIPEEYREKIFEPFFRLRTIERPGTGIGLSLARSLTELHKGTLKLASGQAGNIVFVLTVPIHQEFEFNLGSWKKTVQHER